MEIRQWMTTHEWMVKYTPQTEWIERRGILVWLAEVAGGFGAGLFLVSLYFNNLWGMFIAWLIVVVLKIPLHIIYLGKPWRFWRLIPPFTNGWKTSWYDRGIIFTVFFTGFAFVQLAFSYWLPGTSWEVTFKVLAGISAFLVGIYPGFIMSYCRSIPFWNSALLPIVFILATIADGFALIMVIALAGGQVNIMAVEAASRVLLITNALIIVIYLWSQTYTSATAKHSVLQLLRGYIAPTFWVGVVVFGIIIPIAISVSSYFAGEASTLLLITAVICHTVGIFALKYCLLKAGIHNPVLPATATKQVV